MRPPGYTTPNYGGTGPVPPRPHGQQPPPPYSNPDPSGREDKEINCNGTFGGTFVLLIVVAFVSFYFLPTKIDGYVNALAQMRVQQGVMRDEAQHLEDERKSLEHERLVLKEEREEWERARQGSRVPQGAFWEVVWPRWECRAYGKREYWGILRNVPKNRSEVDACMNMPVKIKGVTVRQPDRCQYMEGSLYIHAFWMVDWDQPDCKPWHKEFHDKGCTNPGSGIRRIEAELAGINKKGQQDWYVLCETTPMTWDHVTYNVPTHCDERDHEKKIAMWDIPDHRC